MIRSTVIRSTVIRSTVIHGVLLIAASAAAVVLAQDAAAPKTVPGNRAEMLEALSALKGRAARLPPPPSEAAAAQTPGPLGVVNNALFRGHYLPAELRTAGGSRQPDPALGIDDTFAVELFWIVSRVNNCHYCLGHQEAKLAAAGMTEPQLLALDTDWTAYAPEKRGAFAFARKLTAAPHTITDADIDALRPHFDPRQILGIVFLVARYNSTNRWTDSLGLPQEDHREFVSQLSAEARGRPSQVAMKGFPARGDLRDLSRDEGAWRAALDRARTRRPRLPLADPAAVSLPNSPWEKSSGRFSTDENLQFSRTPRVRDRIPAIPQAVFPQPAHGGTGPESNGRTSAAAGAPRAYERLLANFPVAGAPWIAQARAAEQAGELPRDLREKIALVAALADGAWYMQHRARRALAARGFDDRQMLAIGVATSAAAPASPPAEAAALAFARRLTLDPQATTDADIEGLLAHFPPRQVAEIVWHVGLAALLDRLTEAAGLGWDEAGE